jgi:hypothetical protein
MKRTRIISSPLHGALDYAIGALLIAAPWIFQFSDVHAAKWTSIGVGAAMLATAAMTNYELGLMRIMPMHLHLAVDGLAGVFLIASPWIFGFADEGANAWIPLLVIGIAELGAALMSNPWPLRTDLARRERDVLKHAARA